MDSVFYTRISTDAGVTALVGSNIDPTWRTPDSPLPYIAYARQATQDIVVLGGTTGVQAITYTLDVWAINAVDTRAIADALYTCLSSWRAAPVQGCFLESDSMQPDEPGFHSTISYQIWATA